MFWTLNNELNWSACIFNMYSHQIHSFLSTLFILIYLKKKAADKIQTCLICFPFKSTLSLCSFATSIYSFVMSTVAHRRSDEKIERKKNKYQQQMDI